MTLNRRDFTLSSLTALGAMSQAPLPGASGGEGQHVHVPMINAYAQLTLPDMLAHLKA